MKTTTDTTDTTERKPPAAIDWQAHTPAPHPFWGSGRPPAKLGRVWLSVQAGPGMYSTPRAHLPRLDQYEAVEVALWLDDTGAPAPLLGRMWLRPSNLIGYDGPGDAEAGFSPADSVAGYVPLAVARRVEEGVRAWAERDGALDVDDFEDEDEDEDDEDGDS